MLHCGRLNLPFAGVAKQKPFRSAGVASYANAHRMAAFPHPREVTMSKGNLTSRNSRRSSNASYKKLPD